MIRAILAILLAAVTTAPAVELRVMGIGALDPGLRNNLDAFGKESGNTVRAQNGTAPVIAQRLTAGETADVIIAPGNVLDDAAKDGKIIATTRTVVARVGVGIVVRKGAEAPVIKTADALKELLLKADSIAYNQGSSGQSLEKLFDKMGIFDRLKGKSATFTSGNLVADHVIASKNNEIGFLPLPYIKSNESRGLQFVGPLPGDTQNLTVYEAVVMTDSKAPDAAKALIKFLTTDAAKKTFAAAGIE